MNLKPLWSSAIAVVSVALVSAAFRAPVRAYPTNAPSAVAAVRLKYHPPDNWLRHYLGDDRYKIAGRVWKVVSTQTDTYYHRPNCPNMLRQPAGIVIGFANWNEAELSGYVPDPLCSPRSSVVIYIAVPSPRNGSGAGGGANAAAQGKRILLADKRSTVLLPRGWAHRALGSQQANVAGHSTKYVGDILAGPKESGYVSFTFSTLPRNVKLETILTPQTVGKIRDQLQSHPASDPGVAAALEGAKVSGASLGGLTGITFVPAKGAKLPTGISGRVIVVGRGSKMYTMAAQIGSNDKSYGVIMNSFQPG